MKPASIKKFDLLYLGSVAVGLLGVFLGWDMMMAQVNAEMARSGTELQGMEGVMSGALVGGIAIGIGISLLLWALISVWRIDFAKWILILFIAWGAISLLRGPTDWAGTNAILGAVSTLMGAAAIYFLFQPDAKEWLTAKK